jgi:hypothetical protein
MEQKKPEEAKPADAAVTPQTTESNALDADPSEAPSTKIDPTAKAEPDKVKQLSPIKQFFKRVNVYLLAFVLIIIVAAAVTIVGYLNSKKTTPEPEVANQQLNQDTLKQLANSDATVGATGQTLTVQGNAIFSGNALIKGDLGVSGTIQAGTGIVVPQITVSGKSNFNDTQVNELQIAGNTTAQGSLTLQKDLNVAGPASFNGPVTIGTLTVNRLVMTGNGSLQIPNHISFPGASPGRTVNPSVLGNGGTSNIGGSDTSGTISISTGSGTVAGCFANVSFNQKFNGTPKVIVSPVGAGAGQTQYYVTRTEAGFSICTAAPAPTNQSFGFDYFVMQ